MKSLTYYFSGAQAKVYIKYKNAEVLLNEAVEISGKADISTTPIYGYKSYLFDSVAIGRVVVSGTFVINYISDAYLLTILSKAYLKAGDDPLKILEAMASSELEKPVNQITQNQEIQIAENSPPSDYFRPLEMPSKNSIVGQYNMITNALNAIDQEMMEDLKRLYWGQYSQDQQGTASLTSKYPMRPEFYLPFDIVIRDYRIGATFETLPNGEFKADYQEKIIKDAIIINYTTVRTADGTPTREVYNFIARNII